MGRRIDRTVSRVSGWLIVDKPAGMTSAAVVARVRRIAGRGTKVGHTGTLDPLATGVLPLALGEATKVVSHVMGGDKTYTFRAVWGEARDTDPAEGEVVARSDVRPDEAGIKAALPQFTGVISQVPPAYSAIKVDGNRAYALARADAAPELAPRDVTVHSFELLACDAEGADFEVVCGKGAYIRSLVRDLAQALGTVGYVTNLRRRASGPFDEKAAISLDNLESLGHSAALLEQVLPVQAALADIPALELTENQAISLRHGQAVAKPYTGNGLVCAMFGSRLVAMAEADGAWIRPTRVFNE